MPNECRRPFWSTPLMTDETVLFSNDVDTRSARLLFKPTEVLSLAAADGLTAYVEGKDYVVNLQTGVITLTQDSAIPSHTLYGDVANHGDWKNSKGEYILWGEADYFHRLQLIVSYRHSGTEWDGNDFLPTPQVDRLPRVTAKLRDGDPITIALTGDSISEGYNASGFVGAPPYQPAYGELVVAGLREKTEADVAFHNVSKAGAGSGWGVRQVDAVSGHVPDLVMVAFGMNDGGKANHVQRADAYESSIRAIVDGLRAHKADVEIILVANMLPNSEFRPHEGHWENRRRLLAIAQQTDGVALADVMSVTDAILQRKKFADISGNNLNHPNDFLHRVYADVILGTFGP